MNIIIDEAGNFCFKFIREGFLNDELKKSGWRNYIFKAANI